MFSYHKESNQVGDHGHHVKGRRHVVTVIDIVDQPHDLGGDDDQLQCGGALGIQEPGEQGSGENGQPADQTVLQRTQGQHYLQGDEEDLQRSGAFAFHENQISKNGHDISDEAAGTAQDQIAEAHKATLNALRNENVRFFSQQSNAYHDQTANAGDQIADEKGVHRITSFKNVAVIIPRGTEGVK